ncbi:MAG: cytochrome c oxidase assembly protein [Actinomycetota bacterium]|nr:cytochrome c oxidase assembly protein [Actinomycetota bacterium]
MRPGPYTWHLHPLAWSVLVVLAAATVLGRRALAARARRAGERPAAWTTAERWRTAGAFAVAAVALTWPLADLAAHWSLTALVVQRLILVLALPPLVLLGLPSDVLAWLTRPAPVERLLYHLRQPVVAVAIVTVGSVAVMTTGLVQLQSSSDLWRGVFDAVVVALGFVLWLPVLGRVPGVLRLRPVGRFSYLIAQSVVPAFLSIIYIFAQHPLYPAFAGSHLAIGLRPLNDQQIAGFVSKIAMLATLITTGAVVLMRAKRDDEAEIEDEPLLWGDVERELARADRLQARGATGTSGASGTSSGTAGPPRPAGGGNGAPPDPMPPDGQLPTTG